MRPFLNPRRSFRKYLNFSVFLSSLFFTASCQRGSLFSAQSNLKTKNYDSLQQEYAGLKRSTEALSQSEKENLLSQNKLSRDYKAGTFLVTLKQKPDPEFSVDDYSELLSRIEIAGGKIVGQLASFDTLYIEIDQEQQNDLAALLFFQASPFTDKVEPNLRFKALAQPSDPKFSEQWYLQSGSRGAINVDPLWEDSVFCHKDLRVAVIDSGMGTKGTDLSLSGHQDLPALAADSYDFAKGDSEPYDDGPAGYHGTAVSSLIFAIPNNGLGIAGLCPGPSPIILRVFDDVGYCDMFKLVQALERAAQLKPHLINMSLGLADQTEILKQAMSRLNDLGIPVVAAAGNSNLPEAFFPANFPFDNIISVGSHGKDGRKSSFSHYGPSIDLTAPGENISTLVPDHVNGVDGKLDDMANLEGTSFSAPIVTAVLGKLLSRFPQAKVSDLKAALLSTLSPFESDADRSSFPGGGDSMPLLPMPILKISFLLPSHPNPCPSRQQSRTQARAKYRSKSEA